MKLDIAIDLFIADWCADGQIRSPHTERAYRECLDLLAEGVGIDELSVSMHRAAPGV